MKQTIPIAFLSAALSACSSGDGDTPQTNTPDNMVTAGETNSGGRLGIVNIEQIGSDTVDGNAFFRAFSEEFQPDFLSNQFDQVADTCEVNSADDEDTDELPTGVLASLSAGETITFSSSTGTYSTFTRSSFDSGITGYIPNSEMAAPQPENLVVDIPGDEFPAFSDVTFPAITPLDMTPADPLTINANTQFQWTSSNSEYTTAVEIDAAFTSTEGQFLQIFCVARDDGSFSFPENIKSQIGVSQTVAALYARSTFRIVQQGDDYLWLLNYREN